MGSPTNSMQYEGILIQRKSIFKTSKPQQYTIRFLFSPQTPTHTLKSFPVIIFQPRVLVLFVHRLLLFPLHPPHLLPFLSSLLGWQHTVFSSHYQPFKCLSVNLHFFASAFDRTISVDQIYRRHQRGVSATQWLYSAVPNTVRIACLCKQY